MLDLSVVICTYNGEARIGQVLERLRSQLQTDSIKWEILVVDNNSSDNTQQIVYAYGSQMPLRYVFEAEQGLAFARSRAVREAAGQWVAFLDDDTLPAEDWVAQAYQFAQARPNIGAFGGQIHANYEVEPPPNFDQVAVFLAVIERGSKPHRYDRVLPPGAGLIVQRQVWLDCVPLKTVLVGRTTGAMLASEDIEAVMHIQRAGWEIWYCPDLHLYHQIPAWRTERSYVLKLVKGMGLARHQIRMMRWQPWQRPLLFVVYLLNDGRKLIVHQLKHRGSDLAIACEQQLLVHSLISPFYWCRQFLRSKLQ